LASRYIFFFFQAEDGIRDDLVTGVQTCALPIYRAAAGNRPRFASSPASARSRPAMMRSVVDFPQPLGPSKVTTCPLGMSKVTSRSEERRVGKEGRSRWSPYH